MLEMATQLGYADYGYTTPVQTASGAPYAEVTANPRYIEDPRVAPSVNPTMMSQFGGSRRRRQRKQSSRSSRSRRQKKQSSRRQQKQSSRRQRSSRSRRQRSRSHQRGGACNCAPSMQVGGGSGSGGYSFALDNTLGKVPSDYPVGACPPAPVATQIGGAAVDDFGIVSHRAGVTYMPQGVVDVGSAQYLDRLTYNADCQSGGARRSRRHKQSSRRQQSSRKQKQSRRQREKSSRKQRA